MSDLTTSDAVIFRRSVTRLAPYLVFSIAEPHRGESTSESIRREFVLAAAHENGGSLDSCTHCCAVCKEKWGIILAPQEVSAAVQQLVTESKVTTFGVTRITLTTDCSQELAERIRSANEVEALALGEWESKVKQSAPSLGLDQVAQLREDLITWIQQIIVERGVEAAVVLYPEQAHYRHRLNEIKALGFSTLPQRDAHVTLMRPEALRGFLEGMTAIQRRYFDNLMTTAYLMSVFTLEPAALDEVRKLTKGQRLYIDTNVIYALVKLHGRAAHERTVHMLNQSRQIGYEICVTPWTVTEMQRSVETARRKLARKESVQASSDHTANDASEGHEMFMEAFRRMQRDAGRITLRDFFALYEQVEELLATEDVMVVADGCQEIDEDDSRLDEQIELLKQARHGDAKLRPVLEHDVKHRLLIEKHRGDGLRRPSNLQCALITNDRGLIRYAAHKRPGELPFAFSFAEWTVRVERLIPRTADYGKTMTDIFGSQALYIHDLVSQTTIIDAISQIHFQEQYTASIGVRMLMDVPLTDNDNDADTEDYERFRSTVSEKEASLEAHALSLEEQLAVLRDVIAAESGARARAEQYAEGLTSQHGPVEKPAKETQPSPDALSRRDFIRWLAASWIAFAAVLALAVPLGAGWITGGAALAGDICGGIGLVVGAFWVLRGLKLAGACITLIASLLTIFVSVQAMIE